MNWEKIEGGLRSKTLDYEFGESVEFEKVEKKTLRQQVYELLKEKMVTAEILPGEQITLRSLAGKLGVSLMPVREALWQLESEGAVVIESNKNMRVNSLTIQDMEEILKIRLKLEIMAVEMACDLRPQSALSKIEKILLEMYESVETPKAYLKKNREYHFLLYKLAESPFLYDIIEGLWTRVGPYIYLVTRAKKQVMTAMGFHQNMFEALRERDKDKISKAMQDDLITAAKGIIQFMETVDTFPAKSRAELFA